MLRAISIPGVLIGQPDRPIASTSLIGANFGSCTCDSEASRASHASCWSAGDIRAYSSTSRPENTNASCNLCHSPGSGETGDPHVPSEIALEEFGVRTVGRSELKDFDAVLFAVAHDEFRGLDAGDLASMVKRQPAPLVDLKWLFDRQEMEQAGFTYWRL